MILNALVKYYESLLERDEIPPIGFSTVKVLFALCLSTDGEVENVIPLRQPETRGKKTYEGPQKMNVPEQRTRTSGTFSFFLCDNAKYILGIGKKDKPAKIEACFQACKDLHLKILEDCTGKCAAAVRNYFTKWNPEDALNHPAMQRDGEELILGGNIIFQIDGQYAQEDAEIQTAWMKFYNQKDVENYGICLVTGQNTLISRLHPLIKGVAGAQSSGASLISYNAPADESYSMEQGANASIGEYAAFAYGAALNHLLDTKENKYRIGDTTIVFWSETGLDQYAAVFGLMFNADDASAEGTDQKLKAVFEKMSKGQAVGALDFKTKFYILGLSPNAARISIRFFIADDFGKIIGNLMAHHARSEICKPSFDHREYISAFGFLCETIREKSGSAQDISPVLEGAFLRSILTDTPYPAALINGIMIRIKAGDSVSRGKAAAIKAFLMKNYDNDNEMKEVLTVSLNEDSNNKAYVLGRLFAYLEKNQYDANGSSSLKEQYFASACAHPGTVFPLLLRLTNYHIAKDSEHKWYKEQDIGRLLDKLEFEEETFPAFLSLKDQGIFILGYYHQTQKRYEKKN